MLERTGECGRCGARVYLDHPHICQEQTRRFEEGEAVRLLREQDAYHFTLAISVGARGKVAGAHVRSRGMDFVPVKFDAGTMWTRAQDLERVSEADELRAQLEAARSAATTEQRRADEERAKFEGSRSVLETLEVQLEELKATVEAQRAALVAQAGRIGQLKTERDAAQAARINEPVMQQARTWVAVWEQLRRGNKDFSSGLTGLDAAVREVARLQDTARDEAHDAHAARIRAEIAERSLANAVRRGDELVADRDKYRQECDALKARAKEFDRRLADMAAEHAREQSAHELTRRELAGWVGAYKDLSARARDDKQSLRTHAHVAPPDGSVEAKRFLVPIELDVPSGWEARMTDFRTVQLSSVWPYSSRKRCEPGCCCAECRAKVM